MSFAYVRMMADERLTLEDSHLEVVVNVVHPRAARWDYCVEFDAPLSSQIA